MTIEAAKGVYDWSKMDGTISTAKRNGVDDYIFTFGGRVPAWASTDPTDPCIYNGGLKHTGQCAPPDLTALDDFTRTIVQRYCGVVKYYEPWNEPNTGFWDGTNEQLLTVVQHIYKIAKDPANCGCDKDVCVPNGGENPNSVLLSPISTLEPKNLAWLDAFLTTAGPAFPYADIASSHQYNLTKPEDAIAEVAAFRNTLSKHGLGNLDVWDSEASWGEAVPAEGQDEAAWLMRFHMAEVVAGVSRFIWYAYDNCEWGTLYVSSGCGDSLGASDTQTDAGDAYKVTQSWLLGTNLTKCLSYNNGLWMCELTRSGGYTAWMLWSDSSSTVQVTIPQNSGLSVYRDWKNDVAALPSQMTIGAQPVLLESTDL